MCAAASAAAAAATVSPLHPFTERSPLALPISFDRGEFLRLDQFQATLVKGESREAETLKAIDRRWWEREGGDFKLLLTECFRRGFKQGGGGECICSLKWRKHSCCAPTQGQSAIICSSERMPLEDRH